MLDRISRFHRTIATLIAVLLCAVPLTPIQAAQGGKVLGPREVTEKEWQRNKEQFNKLLTGEITPELPRDKAVLDAASQYLVYRVTWPTLQADKWESGMGKVQAEFEKAIDQPATKERLLRSHLYYRQTSARLHPSSRASKHLLERKTVTTIGWRV